MSLLIHSARGGEEAGWRVYHKLNASPEVRDRNQRGEEESKGKITFVYVERNTEPLSNTLPQVEAFKV